MSDYETVRHYMSSGEGYTLALAALERMHADEQRFLGGLTKDPQTDYKFLDLYYRGTQECWTLDQWRTAGMYAAIGDC